MEHEQITRPQLNELQKFQFAKTDVLAGLVTTGEAIALKPVIENLGLDWSSQLKRIKRDPILNELWSYVKTKSSDGKTYDMVCFPPMVFQDWLYNLNMSENLNIPLWESYKKGLVVHLLMMLKISLEEIKRLKQIETDYNELLEDTHNYFLHDEKLSEYHSAGQLCRKEKARFKDQILSKMRRNPNQTVIEFNS